VDLLVFLGRFTQRFTRWPTSTADPIRTYTTPGDVTPGSVTYDIRRIRGADDIWVAEMTVSYDDGEPRYGVDVLEIRNGKIVVETVYVGEPFDAPAWRAQWRDAP
jgi:hypothetical protein